MLLLTVLFTNSGSTLLPIKYLLNKFFTTKYSYDGISWVVFLSFFFYIKYYIYSLDIEFCTSVKIAEAIWWGYSSAQYIL